MKRKSIKISIRGEAGSGKSTVARHILDTLAMAGIGGGIADENGIEVNRRSPELQAQVLKAIGAQTDVHIDVGQVSRTAESQRFETSGLTMIEVCEKLDGLSSEQLNRLSFATFCERVAAERKAGGCECGAASMGSSYPHADYCPQYVKP